MSELAILGGEPVRRQPFSPWPQYAGIDLERLRRVLQSRNWGGYPFPNTLAAEFAGRFAQYHGAEYGCCVANGTVALLVALALAVEKVMRNLDELARADPAIAGVKSMSRAERPRLERERNY